MGKLVGNYRVNVKMTSPGTDTATITGYEVPRGQTAILTFMSIIDYTSNLNELMLGIKDAAGNEHMLHFELGTTTDVRQSAKIEGEVVLIPGDKPFGRVLSPSTSDVIYFSAHGGLYKEEAPVA
jgi:hypothetical protein